MSTPSVSQILVFSKDCKHSVVYVPSHPSAPGNLVSGIYILRDSGLPLGAQIPKLKLTIEAVTE